jgi:Rrf2 family protein
MIEIANGDKEKGVFQKDIAFNQSLSNKYLDQIIQSLKTANLIRNSSGKKSGYVLTRKAEDITVYDIHRAFDPDICFVECLSGFNHCERSETCKARGFWNQLNILVATYFKSVTLDNIINGMVKIEQVDFISNLEKQKI